MKAENARPPEKNRYVLLALTMTLLFLVKYNYLIKNHSLDNYEGDDKTFIIYGDKIAKGILNESDKKTVYDHIQKPLMMFIPAVLIKLGLIKHYLLLPFAFDMLLFTAVFLAVEEKTHNTLIALGGSILASWNTLLGYYSFQFLPEMPFAASILAFTVSLDRMLKTRKTIYAYACGIFTALAVLFRLDSVIVILAVNVIYAVKALAKGRSNTDFRNITLATLLGLGLVALYFAAYVSILEGRLFGLDEFTGLLGRIWDTGRLVLTEETTESKGVFMFLPHMLLLASTPLVFFFAILGVLHTFRRRGLLETYTLTFLVLLTHRWVIFYIGKGAQKYLTCFMPFLSIFAVVGAYQVVETIASRLKTSRTVKNCLLGVLLLLMIYSAYFWIHEPIPGSKVRGYKTMAILLKDPLDDCYEWDQRVGELHGYLLFRDGLRTYVRERKLEPKTVYTNVGDSWVKFIEILEEVEVRDIGEYKHGEEGIIAIGAYKNDYTPKGVFWMTDRFDRKIIIMDERGYLDLINSGAYGVGASKPTGMYANMKT